MRGVSGWWVAARLRAAPGAACALALLVALTAALAAAFPRALDRHADAGLHHALARAHPDRTGVLLTAPGPYPELPRERREEAVRPPALAALRADALALVEEGLPVDRAQSPYGVRTQRSLEVPEPWLPRPTGSAPRMFLAAQDGLADHARLASGRLPGTSGDPVTAATGEVEAAVSAETAETLRIGVGAVLRVPAPEGPPLTVRVTGIVTPDAPDSPYWATQPVLRTPVLATAPGSSAADPDRYWVGALLLDPEAAPALLGTAGNPIRYWQFAPRADALRAHDTDRLLRAVASLESGPAQARVHRLIGPETDVSTGLDEVLASYGRLRSGIGPLVAVAAAGTGTVAGVALLMAGGLAAGRRHAELALLRARGASLRGLAGRLLAETAVVAVPAGAAGLAAALLAFPGARTPPAVAAAVAVTVLACLALPVRAVVAHRAVRVHDGRRDLVSARPSRRRAVAELTAVALAAGAVETLRRQGAAGTADGLVVLAPVLTGVIAALLLVRLLPWPLRGLAGRAGRLRGAVGWLALARAGRTSASPVLPLLALLTALTTAAFGGAVLNGVAQARDRAALLAVGADARVEASAALPGALPGRLRAAPGVEAVTEVSLLPQARVWEGRHTVPLAGVDPAAYAALAARTDLGAFPAGALAAGGGAGGPPPALASPAVAERFGSGPVPVRLDDGTSVTVRIALVRELTPAVSGDDFLVVDRAALSAEAARPTVLLLTGDRPDAGALRAATGDAGSVRTRAEERGRAVDSPLQSGAERVYTAAVAAGAGYAALALLLSLLRAAPERAALLARLRTMGLTRGQGRRLLVLESLPQAVLATAGGALTGWAAVALLAPGVDLTAIALPSASAAVGTAVPRTDPWSLAVPALGVPVVTVGVAVAQAWWSGRRGSVTELRAGDPG
ncbi:FtsX-like permease family protein [Streptomyces sp. SCSIO 75703]|uniref:FtsX-like permease family protein n=1 Tax=Streptomyces sp. SCSIO 75703 TaxID=3112165 RepID=UPI0030CAFF40